jgi:hypothetical protein
VIAKHLGYLRVDNRVSGGQLVEADVLQCPHCQAVIAERGPTESFCDRCMAPVCSTEACAKSCTPFLRTIERQMARQYHREQFARVAGLEG